MSLRTSSLFNYDEETTNLFSLKSVKVRSKHLHHYSPRFWSQPKVKSTFLWITSWKKDLIHRIQWCWAFNKILHKSKHKLTHCVVIFQVDNISTGYGKERDPLPPRESLREKNFPAPNKYISTQYVTGPH